MRHSNEHGFSLVELVIGMAVMGLIMAAVFGVLSSSLNIQGYGNSQEASFNQVRSVTDAICEELRYSTVAAPAPGTSANNISYTTRLGENRQIYIGTTGAEANRVVITRSSGNLLLGNGLISSIRFDRNNPADNRLITVMVTATSGTGTTAATITLKSDVRIGTI